MRIFLAVVLLGGALVALGIVATRPRGPLPSPTPTARAVAASPAPTPSPTPTRGRAVVFVSAPSAAPFAVDDPKGIEGDSAGARVYYRLLHLWAFRGPVPPGYVPLASVVKARPYRVGLADDLVFVTFVVPAEGWGIDASQVKMLLQQIVFTATEEPGVDRVRLRQEGDPTYADPLDGPPVIIAGTRVPLILTRENVLR